MQSGIPLHPAKNSVRVIQPVGTAGHPLDRTEYFRRLKLYLKPSARVAIVDFKPGELPVGPPPAMKIDTDTVIEEVESAGYRLAIDDRKLLPHQDLLIFELPTLRYYDR